LQERVDKNNFPPQTILWKRRIALFCLLAMAGSLFFSRAVASISMILFGINALWGVSPKEWLRQRWWLLGLGWVALYALSYFWTDDKGEWSAHVQVKLPFLLLPLSFALLPRFTAKDLRVYTWCLISIMLIGAAYSFSFFWRENPANVFSQYVVFAHLLPTPMYNDHIAFSTAVALSIAWVVFYVPYIPRKREQVLLLILAGLLAAYLHILAAKSGLIALYIFSLGFIVRLAVKKPGRALLALLLVAGLLSAALATLPTLRGRIRYSYATWMSYRMGERQGLYSDASRMISYSIAARLIAQHPAGGVGAGDVLHEMNKGYTRWYPDVPEAQQLWPHNQWLTCALAAGLPAVLLFTLWIAAPLRRVRRDRAGSFFVIVWMMLLVPLMVDPFLEVQIGVAVFLIFLLMQRAMLTDPLQIAAVRHD
jgi:O-antigen ligase